MTSDQTFDPSQLGPAVGTRFPDIALPDQSGTPLDLHAYREGRPTLFVVHRSALW
jgi:hypothetical protein